MNRMVLGIVVDDDIYDKYQFDKETGRRRMYTLCGQERSLDAIEFYAGSADYAKESPKLVKEAKRIAEGIRKEIKQYYAAKDGRKEHIAMKHDTFEEYLRDLQEIHAKVAPERRELKQKWDEAQKRWQEDQREYKGTSIIWREKRCGIWMPRRIIRTESGICSGGRRKRFRLYKTSMRNM